VQRCLHIRAIVARASHYERGSHERGPATRPVIVTMDADGQHPPEEIPRPVETNRRRRRRRRVWGPRRDGRMPCRAASRIGCPPPWHRGSAGQRVNDAQNGLSSLLAQGRRGCATGGRPFTIRGQFLLDALRAGFRVVSVDVPTIYGPRSHFRSWVDTWRMARAFARHAGRIVLGAT